ncbi:alpha/beta hydrolase [Dactylosporangium sp. NPDC049140]|uniref:alpha/beta fold hydrolase n=1 Tax=Dactylosporangium sp. NPDC049140 TaxID=3155647 RepID=UPI0033C05F3D
MPTFTTGDGVRLHYEDEGHGRPVVLVAGFCAPLESWELLQSHAEQDWRDVVARLQVPSLFIAGRDSQLWPCEHATAAAATNPLAQVVTLEDCGHAANLDQPDATNAAILEFLR